MGRIVLACLLVATVGHAAPRGRVKLLSVKTAGQITEKSKRIARKVSSSYLSGIKRCYAKTLAAEPEASGILAVDITVAEVGRVQHAEVEGVDDDLDGCVRDLAKKWLFPPLITVAQEFQVRFVLTP